MEKEASSRTAREVDVHVGGWHLLGCQSDDGGGHRGKSKRRVVDENLFGENPPMRDGIEAIWRWLWRSHGAKKRMTQRWTENVSRAK